MRAVRLSCSEGAWSPGYGAIRPWSRLPSSALPQEGEEAERDEQRDEQKVAACGKEDDGCEGDSDREAAHGGYSFFRDVDLFRCPTVRLLGQRARQGTARFRRGKPEALGLDFPTIRLKIRARTSDPSYHGWL
jgi:hypothetical protein